jgi:hypothetical protein
MLGAIREVKRRVQVPGDKIAYCPNLFKTAVIIKEKQPIEHDESDDIEKTKRRVELDADFYKMPIYVNPFENPSIKPKTFSPSSWATRSNFAPSNMWGSATITME